VKLLAATRSAGKQRELRRLLEAAGHEVVFPDDAGLPERPEEDLLETEPSFEANARRKAEYFAKLSGLPPRLVTVTVSTLYSPVTSETEISEGATSISGGMISSSRAKSSTVVSLTLTVAGRVCGT